MDPVCEIWDATNHNDGTRAGSEKDTALINRHASGLDPSTAIQTAPAASMLKPAYRVMIAAAVSTEAAMIMPLRPEEIPSASKCTIARLRKI